MCRFIRTWAPAFAGVTMFLFVVPAQAGTSFPGIGRPATPAEIKAWDIDVRPDFTGLPPGSGSVQKGQQVWDAKCASCHGTFGESNEVFTPIVGGTTKEDIRRGRVASLTAGEQRTTLMKLPTISTLWDYVNRAMPWNAPKSLTTEEVYAVVAYILHLGDILPADFVLSDRNIAQVQERLPNRNGMTREHGLWDVKGKADVRNVACMKNCAVETTLASALPEHARGDHGNLAEQNRSVGPTRGLEIESAPPGLASAGAGAATAAAAAPTGTTMPVAELAKRKACLSCHGVEKRIVGPSFKEVSARYKGQPGVEARLLEKLKRGGSGTWGPLPMPPNPDLAEADAAALIRWVLDGAG
jgi:S-disulfanyl-L-cysteine oxidoreductase SoxD